MDFDQIIFYSTNAFHVYDVSGQCNFASNGLNRAQLVVCTLNEPVDLPLNLYSIEVNGIAFKCSSVQISGDRVVGEIEQITSFEYTDALKFS